VLLLPVFQEMRRLGADLSMAEYILAIKMLRDGVGLESAAALAEACRLLWAKSREEQEMFDVAFEEKAVPLLKILPSRLALTNEEGDATRETAAFEDDEELDAPVAQEELLGLHLAVEPLNMPFVPAESPAPIAASLSGSRVYHFTTRLPLSRSEMSGHWRQLRRMQRTKPTSELDTEATIYDICQHGLLRKPFMRPHAGNAAQLLMLIDQDGSMTPFKLLIEALLESVMRNSLAGRAAVYYFHDCPVHTLYEDSMLGQPVALEQVLARYNHNSHVLIVSDAGAARAHYDDERVSQSRRFLELLHRYTYLYAWINPVPCSRWRFTTAEDIEQLVPMFPLDRDGLDDAIQILRGHPFPPGVRLHG
jgi:uncharacterized protein with von Willebrand factor type A (vWA) domain